MDFISQHHHHHHHTCQKNRKQNNKQNNTKISAHQQHQAKPGCIFHHTTAGPHRFVLECRVILHSIAIPSPPPAQTTRGMPKPCDFGTFSLPLRFSLQWPLFLPSASLCGTVALHGQISLCLPPAVGAYTQRRHRGTGQTRLSRANSDTSPPCIFAEGPTMRNSSLSLFIHFRPRNKLMIRFPHHLRK